MLPDLPMARISVVLVDDEEGVLRSILHEAFAASGIDVVGAERTIDATAALLRTRDADMLLVDHCEAAGRGSRGLLHLLERDPRLAAVLLLADTRRAVMAELSVGGRTAFTTTEGTFQQLIAAVLSLDGRRRLGGERRRRFSEPTLDLPRQECRGSRS